MLFWSHYKCFLKIKFGNAQKWGEHLKIGLVDTINQNILESVEKLTTWQVKVLCNVVRDMAFHEISGFRQNNPLVKRISTE